MSLRLFDRVVHETTSLVPPFSNTDRKDTEFMLPNTDHSKKPPATRFEGNNNAEEAVCTL